ncbi:retrovirus-related pol polyprotein from transposon TNT 1-94 [Tanacetum coccineum]|uniref:Retrovirus-related pol polyprotein from transposon TNT 1-94 n=1 Tax=Tanacetum coccineum TaxID=301880 RepID=A0ABQ4Z9C5_9ASTR
MVLRVKKKLFVIEQPIPPAPPDDSTSQVIHFKKGIAKYTKVSSMPQKCLDLDSSYFIQEIILLGFIVVLFNTIITSLKALDESFSSCNHVRKFLRALPSKWRPKVTAIEESKYLSKLSLDELVGNLKVYEVVLEKDLEIAKNKKEKYKSLTLKARQVLSDDDTSSSDSNDEEYAMTEDKKEDRICFKCGDPNHFFSDCPKNSSGDQKAFVVKSWSDSGDDSKKEEICLMAHSNENFEKPNHVFKLKKALYGLKQAPKAWYDHLKAFLLDHMYTMGLVDNTLFTKKKDSHIIIVQIYVDDIIFRSTCQDLCDDFSKIMHDEFEMSMMYELNFILGLQIKQLEDGIFFNQSKYVKEILKKFGLKNAKPIKTPMSSETKLTCDEEGKPIDDTKYHGMIGSLLYLTGSCPDIMFSVCLCARFQEAPKTSHLEAVKRIFHYIKGTSHLGLWYPKGTCLETIVYANSDHAGDYVDRKSASGVCTFVGCYLTSWMSKKQTALAISTTEAEYVSARKACQQALWMKQALVDYEVKTSSPSYQPFSPPSDYTSGAPPTSLITSPPLSPINTTFNSNCLLTPKTTPPPLTSPPSAPTQPSKLTSPVTINLDPIELLFSTSPSSPSLLVVLGDLPPLITNPSPHRPSFATIERLANKPPPIPPMNSSFPSPTPELEPTPPPLPP